MQIVAHGAFQTESKRNNTPLVGDMALPPAGSYLVLVGGVEGDLCDLQVLVPHLVDGATAQLDALQ